MTPFNRIVCPVDFSDFSRRALGFGVAIARWYGVPLTALYVQPVADPVPALFAGLATAMPERTSLSTADRHQLHREVEALLPKDSSDVTVSCAIAEGRVANEIIAEAGSTDLIVMGTHGRSGFERYVIGSVTDKVLRKAQAAVMTVPQSRPAPVGSVPTLFHRIMAAVDWSAPSREGLVVALSLAGDADAHLTLLHVVEVPRYLSQWIDEGRDAEQAVAQWKAQALTRLRSVAGDEVRRHAHVEPRVEAGVAYREILRVASEEESELIVIGAHGETIHATFVGSTVQHVVRSAECPVLVMRPREEPHRDR